MMNTRLLPVQLNEEEIKVKGEELAKTTEAHRDLEAEKKRSAAGYTQAMKDSTKKMLELAKIVNTGKEDRQVPVRKDFNPGRNLCSIYRTDTNELVEARSMTEEEYQKELWDEDEILEERNSDR
jgi:hypothetical protein